MDIQAGVLDQAAEELTEALRTAGDSKAASQLIDLRNKLTDGRLIAAFCGHFSAGKSTLINRLCGAKLLPSSPIPTSANVVSIRGGSPPHASIMTVRDGEQVTIEAPIDKLDDYCVDGEQFQSVSIIYPSELLGDHTVLLDTPGIDSTDDAHRMATESALHLADVVFYVMDYNHVQSEINFTFAKQLKDWGKPLYFIVNQIDKHREQELSFAAYRRSVEEAFAAWHLEPAGILYLSMREPAHPHQELDKLQSVMKELAAIRGGLSAYSVDASLRHVVQLHIRLQEEISEPERARLLNEAGGEERAAEVQSEIDRYDAELAVLADAPHLLRKELREEIESLLANANITPAPMRDLAQSFLESRKPGFKTGLFFAGAKTAAEQERRLEAFRSEFESRVTAAIDWHVKDVLRLAAHRLGFASEELERRFAEELSWKPEPSWLVERVKAGAVIGNEYTMTYSRDLAADVKGIYRKRALELIDALSGHLAAASTAAADGVRAQLAALGAQAGALAELAAQRQRAEAHAAELTAALPPRTARPALPAPAAHSAGNSTDTIEAAVAGQPAASQPTGVASSSGERRGASLTAAARTAPAGGAARALQQGAAERLLRAAELLAPHAPLGAAVRAMREKAGRLQHSRFTIALFGAFSAGKSSLANALIGEPVLPVSPNPTTAAINRLMPPSADRPHGTARIAMKTRAAMLSDLRYSLALLGEELPGDAEDISAAAEASILQAIDRLSPSAIHAGGRPHYSFLRAARTGWAAHAAQLGQELQVGQDDYERFVAEEARSCFVSEIELYYDCPLTAQGIVLVDTPGADSVNARHTGVAFNYIKNADAVLFVTYYNHAFSQADRQFLMQLGRVKDQFELDKMFFLVNAADLAADQEELAGVLKHVETNLLQHGIRKPRLFPVSSLQGLDAKLANDSNSLRLSGIDVFEQSFLSFIQSDLGKLAIDAAEQDLERARAVVAQWIASAAGDAETRMDQRDQLTKAAASIQHKIDQLAQEPPPEQLHQELQELLFYVIQRLQLRFGEFYNLAFNPSVLQDDGRDLRRMLWTAWLELQRIVQTELSQELLATSLRMEKNLIALARQTTQTTAQYMEQELEGYQAAPIPMNSLPTPDEAEQWQSAQVEPKWLWSRFRSPRQFFEGDGKAQLRQDLEALLAPSFQAWMAERTAEWQRLYDSHWESVMEACALALRQDAEAYKQGKLASLADGADLQSLRELQERLTHLTAVTVS
ncbi:dynamin family protein [Paenibacillus sp. GCM10023252]|uniref:dynamin family protein n=1 Tax=Paenibacillus sp. GCM10023252 TaxID=3252649 RepID=UPI00360FB9B2